MRYNPLLLLAIFRLAETSPVDFHPLQADDSISASQNLHLGRTVIDAPYSAENLILQDRDTTLPRAAKSTSATCPAANTTSATTKAARWLSGLVRRATEYGTLDIPTAAEPLDKWATKIYKDASKNKAVYVNFEQSATPDYRPTSRFEKFGDTPFYMTLTGLYGCTSVVVASYCGAYMSHFWDPVMNDGIFKTDTSVFIAGAEDALKGVKNLAAETKATKNVQWKPSMAPANDFISLEAHKSCLSKDYGAQAFIFTPIASGGTSVPADPNTVSALKTVVADLTGLKATDIATHLYKSPGETTAKAKTNGQGKVLLSYNPATGAKNQEHAYQVHVKKMDTPSVTMVLGDTWHGDANQCTCPNSPLLVKRHDPSCCCAIQ